MRAITGPAGLIVLGVAVVLGVGYWAKNYRPQSEPPQQQSPAVSAPKTAAQNQAPAAAPATQPAVQTPPPAADPTKDLLDKRTHIDRSAGAAKTALVTIYYADGLQQADTLQPVEVRIEQTTALIKRTAELVVGAPEDLKLYSGVPAGTKVLSVDYNATTGVATVDLSAELAKAQAGDVAKIKAAFVYSLAQISGVKAVQLWVNGHPAMLHEQEWSKPLTPADIDALKAFTVQPVLKYQP